MVENSMRPVKSRDVRPAWLTWGRWVLPGLCVAAAVAWFAHRTPSPPPTPRQFNVSQRGREFRPGLLELDKGDLVHIVNDDGDVSHHAYVATPKFSFDSGDQEPGTAVTIAFSVTGTFNVLCGIHPKMRLIVKVQ